MPKIRSHKGTTKRFRVTRTGKIMCRRAMSAKKLEKKSPKRKRGYDNQMQVSTADARRIRRAAPYL